jgi:hypothetical protein
MIPINATPPTAVIGHAEGSGTTDTTASPKGDGQAPDEAGVNHRSGDGIVFANRVVARVRDEEPFKALAQIGRSNGQVTRVAGPSPNTN